MNKSMQLLQFAMQTPQKKIEQQSVAPRPQFGADSGIQKTAVADTVQFSGKKLKDEDFGAHYANMSRKIGQRFGIDGLKLNDNMFATPEMVRALLGNQDTLNVKDPLLGLALEQMLIACVNFTDLKHDGWFSGKKEDQALYKLTFAMVEGLTHPYEEVSTFCEDFIKKHNPGLLNKESVQEKITLTRDKEEAVKTANQIFKLLGLNHKVNRSNVFSSETVKALLKSTPENEQETDAVYSLLNIIEPRLLKTEHGRKEISFMYRDYKNMTDRLENDDQRYLKAHCDSMAEKIETNQLEPATETTETDNSSFDISLNTTIQIKKEAAKLAESIKLAVERNIEIKKYLDEELGGLIPDATDILDAVKTDVRQKMQEEDPHKEFSDLEYNSRILTTLRHNMYYLTYGYPKIEARPVGETTDEKLNILLRREAKLEAGLQIAKRDYFENLTTLEIEKSKFELAEEKFAQISDAHVRPVLSEAIKQREAAEKNNERFVATAEQNKAIKEYHDIKETNQENKEKLELATNDYQNRLHDINQDLSKSQDMIDKFKEELAKLHSDIEKKQILENRAAKKETKYDLLEEMLADDEAARIQAEIDKNFGKVQIQTEKERHGKDLLSKAKEALSEDLLDDISGIEAENTDDVSDLSEETVEVQATNVDASEQDASTETATDVNTDKPKESANQDLLDEALAALSEDGSDSEEETTQSTEA